MLRDCAQSYHSPRWNRQTISKRSKEPGSRSRRKTGGDRGQKQRVQRRPSPRRLRRSSLTRGSAPSTNEDLSCVMFEIRQMHKAALTTLAEREVRTQPQRLVKVSPSKSAEEKTSVCQKARAIAMAVGSSKCWESFCSRLSSPLCS